MKVTLDPRFLVTRMRVRLSKYRSSAALRFHLARGLGFKETSLANTIKSRTLPMIESLRVPDGLYGRYRYCPSQSDPVLYASTYAALTRHLVADLDDVSSDQREQWSSYIAEHQDEDGLFKDPMVENEIAATEDWWGWRHLTVQTLMALHVLGDSAPRELRFLTPMKGPDAIRRWLERQPWATRPDFVSNAVMNVGVALQYSRDTHHDSLAGKTIEALLEWLAEHQDSSSGLWGPPFDSPELLSRGIQTAYHLWLLFFYDQRPIPHIDRIIPRLVESQNSLGGFGVSLNSSACEDIDSIDPLVRFKDCWGANDSAARSGLGRALRWVLANMNPDGGFVFRRGIGFEYGHHRMYSGQEESSLFATWFRLLSVAYIAQVYQHPVLTGVEWRFSDCPGYQFFKGTGSGDTEDTFL